MATATTDHYAMLGVPANATADQIREAFRRRSKQCHPDRGGSDAEMIAVIEAWEILGDANKRAAYDRGRAEPWDQTSVAGRDRVEREAAQRAKVYPRNWTDYERWMGVTLGDVVQAEYGEKSFGWFGGGIPIAIGSVSGNVFIVAGAILALAIFISFHWYNSLVESLFAGTPQLFGRPVRFGGELLFLVFLATLPPICGAWAGRFLHQVVRDQLRRSRAAREARSTATAAPASPIVLQCRSCRQQLRLPRSSRPLAVTCPRCRSTFHYEPEK